MQLLLVLCKCQLVLVCISPQEYILVLKTITVTAMLHSKLHYLMDCDCYVALYVTLPDGL